MYLITTSVLVLSMSVQCWALEPVEPKNKTDFTSPGIYTGRYISHQNCRNHGGNHFCLEVDFESEDYSIRRFTVLYPEVKDTSGRTLFSFDIANSDHQGFSTTRATARKMLGVIFITRDIVSIELVNHSFSDIPYYFAEEIIVSDLPEYMKGAHDILAK